MRWPAHGWLVGKINEKFTSATPRLFAKFNFRVKWFDGWENHKFLLDNYNSGPSAPFNSWVLLEKEAAGAGPSDAEHVVGYNTVMRPLHSR